MIVKSVQSLRFLLLLSNAAFLTTIEFEGQGIKNSR